MEFLDLSDVGTLLVHVHNLALQPGMFSLTVNCTPGTLAAGSGSLASLDVWAPPRTAVNATLPLAPLPAAMPVADIRCDATLRDEQVMCHNILCRHTLGTILPQQGMQLSAQAMELRVVGKVPGGATALLQGTALRSSSAKASTAVDACVAICRGALDLACAARYRCPAQFARLGYILLGVVVAVVAVGLGLWWWRRRRAQRAKAALQAGAVDNALAVESRDISLDGVRYSTDEYKESARGGSAGSVRRRGSVRTSSGRRSTPSQRSTPLSSRKNSSALRDAHQ